MAVRFETLFTNIKDQRYRIVVDDEDTVSAPKNATRSGADGFTLTYEGQNQERFNPILPSKLGISFDINNAQNEAVIPDLVNSREGRFKLLVTVDRGGFEGFVKFWVGTVTVDQVSIPDLDIPYYIRVTAIDQIATLSKVKYSIDETTPYDGNETLLQHILRILGKTNAGFFYTDIEDFLVTTGEWYDDDHDYDGTDKVDTWITTRLDHQALYTQDEEGNYNFKTCYEVLQGILTTMGSRIYQSGGVFYIEQINNRANAQHYEWRYSKLGVQNSEGLVDDEKTLGHGLDIEILADAVYTWLPGLKSIILNYNHGSDRNLLLGNAWNQSSNNLLLVGEIESDTTTTTLSFSANLYVKVKLSGSGVPGFDWRFQFSLLMKHGTKYLDLDLSNYGDEEGFLEWVDTSNVYEVSTPWLSAPNTVVIPIRFETPVLETALADLEFDFNVFGAYKGIDMNQPDDINIDNIEGPLGILQYLTIEDWKLLSPKLELFSEGDPAKLENTRRFRINNDDAPNNTEILEIDTFIGDAITNVTKGKLQILNSSAAWENSDAWSINQGLPTRSIMELLLWEMMAGQKTGTKILNGTMYGPGMNATTKLLRNGESYLFMGGGFNAMRAEWSGEWFNLLLDRTNMSFGTPITTGGSSTVGGTTNTGVITSYNNQPPLRENFINHQSDIVNLTNKLPTDVDRNFVIYRGGGPLIVNVDFTVTGTNQITLSIPAMGENLSAFIYV